MKKQDVLDRFWSRVRIDVEGCWLWQGAKDTKGYGYFNGRRAHRLMYGLGHEVPDDLMVLHDCDTPSCVRPSHLYVGTAADNARDKVERGRCPRGEDKKTPLTERDVEAILRSDATGVVLAKQYGVCTKTISNIRRGRRWLFVKERVECQSL